MKSLLTHPRLQRAGRSAVATLARRVNYHVLRGMADPAVRPDTDRFFAAATWTITQDYVRDATLELLCREIAEHDVPGALAELGVFRGDFAWLMSSYLPERPIHLFDTFGGFDAEDLEFDEREGLVAQSIDFSPTAPAAVAARFASPELVALHVGRFPDTADGVAGPFALVSIDADLYAPMRSALSWFFERLSPGGAILAHDFNNAQFGGARKAVREFQDATGVAIVPLPDWGGTAVIVKPRAAAQEPG